MMLQKLYIKNKAILLLLNAKASFGWYHLKIVGKINNSLICTYSPIRILKISIQKNSIIQYNKYSNLYGLSERFYDI